MFASAIIPAAGYGIRFGEKKQFKELNGKPLILHTLSPFFKSTTISDIVIATQTKDIDTISDIVKLIKTEKRVRIVEGGNNRQSSIQQALNYISPNTKYVCVHDAVRPFVSIHLIDKMIDALKSCDAIIVGHQSTDTLKEVREGIIQSTINREKIWNVQTPQAFSREVIMKAYELAEKENLLATDDASLVERAGYQVKIIRGSSNNFKITTMEDWIMAEALLSFNKNV
tara:strand:- start:36 stop:719 length:684 start_codon:yes stop_codon:yes gene_type:complete